jgi:hypothetical protein
MLSQASSKIYFETSRINAEKRQKRDERDIFGTLDCELLSQW